MIIDTFMRWFNFVAEKADKPKFRTQREAIDFVRHVANASGGPNAKILKMRKDYVSVLKEQKARGDSATAETRPVSAKAS